MPLGLFKAGNGGFRPHHQVVAVGYDLGRYTGDLGEFKADLKISSTTPTTRASDDLRGGNDNVNATITFKNQPPLVVHNLNNGARWIGNYTQTVPITLDRAVPVARSPAWC